MRHRLTDYTEQYTATHHCMHCAQRTAHCTVHGAKLPIAWVHRAQAAAQAAAARKAKEEKEKADAEMRAKLVKEAGEKAQAVGRLLAAAAQQAVELEAQV